MVDVREKSLLGGSLRLLSLFTQGFISNPEPYVYDP